MKHIAIADATFNFRPDGFYAYVSDSEAGTLTVINQNLVTRDDAIAIAAEYMVANPGHVAGHAITQAARTLQLCDADFHSADDAVYAWRCSATIEDVLAGNIPPMPNTRQPEYMGYETWQIDGRG